MASEWIDFQAVKEAVSIEAILAKYNVALRRVNQSSLRGACPLPSHTTKGTPSCASTSTREPGRANRKVASPHAADGPVATPWICGWQ